MGARLLALLLVLSLASSCAADDSSSATETPTSSSPADDRALEMTCTGDGAPTVVLEAGLDTSGETFAALADTLAATTRVCRYDRAGVGLSAALDPGDPDPWPGSSADALAAELESRGEAAPYVVLGWSYGGMVAQAFATRHADLTAGVVLEDSSVPEQFADAAWDDIAWVDGGREVDADTAVAELSELDLGDLPVVVLTADELEREAAEAVERLPRPVDRLVGRRGARTSGRRRPRDPRVGPGPGRGRRGRRGRDGPRRDAVGAVCGAVRRPRRPLPLAGQVDLERRPTAEVRSRDAYRTRTSRARYRRRA